MDPQQRIVLEVAWAALEHAGIPPSSLRGSRTGVFVGLSATEYGSLTMTDVPGVDVWSGTGAAASITANRLSYLLDLRGPSLTLDTACSSSLVAVHQAVQSLRLGESEIALAAGVNVLLSPGITAGFHRAGVLAADGHCKPFDAGADGIARGEGCGVVVLKPLRAARRDGDRVLAVHPRQRGELRRPVQRPHGAQPGSPGRPAARRLRGGGCRSVLCGLRRGPRHGHPARRPAGGGRPRDGARRRPRPRASAAARFGQEQPRPPRRRGRDGGADQGGAGDAEPAGAAEPALPRAEPAHRLHGAAGGGVGDRVAALFGHGAGRGVGVRLRRDERARGAGGVAGRVVPAARGGPGRAGGVRLVGPVGGGAAGAGGGAGGLAGG